LDDNLAASKHGIPGSSDSVTIDADAFDDRQLKALGPEVTEKSLLVARTALTQDLEQRIPTPWPLKHTIEEINIETRLTFAAQVPNQVGRAKRDCALSPLHGYSHQPNVDIGL